MKKTNIVSILTGTLITIILSGCVVSLKTPGLIISNPVPVVTYQPAVEVGIVPDVYTWDGFEYVGIVNGVYFYYGAGGWYHCEPWRLERFHGWERGHGEWRSHETHNEHHQGGSNHHH